MWGHRVESWSSILFRILYFLFHTFHQFQDRAFFFFFRSRLAFLIELFLGNQCLRTYSSRCETGVFERCALIACGKFVEERISSKMGPPIWPLLAMLEVKHTLSYIGRNEILADAEQARIARTVCHNLPNCSLRESDPSNSKPATRYASIPSSSAESAPKCT